MTKTCPKCGGTGIVLEPKEQGGEMRKLREAAGLSMRVVAQRMKVSPAYLSDLELGNRQWNAEREETFKAALRTAQPAPRHRKQSK